jgi:ParB/RepB/Spo0J family partition protein
MSAQPSPQPARPGGAVRTEAIPLGAIAWGPQPRTEFDEAALQELAASMKRRGQLCPARVRRGGQLGYVGVFGERRYRAAKLLGWTSIDAVVVEGEPTEADLTLEQLSENVFRDELRPIERANAYRRVMADQKWTAKELASHLGVSPAKVCQDLKLLGLSEDIQAAVNAGKIPTTAAYAITGAPAAAQAELARQVTEGKATRDQVRDQVRNGRAGPPGRDSKPSLKFAARPPYRFEIKGNTVTVAGKKLDSRHALVEAARAFAKAAETLLKNPDKNIAEWEAALRGAAAPATAEPQNHVPSSPDAGRVADGGEPVSEAPKEGNS